MPRHSILQTTGGQRSAHLGGDAARISRVAADVSSKPVSKHDIVKFVVAEVNCWRLSRQTEHPPLLSPHTLRRPPLCKSEMQISRFCRTMRQISRYGASMLTVMVVGGPDLHSADVSTPPVVTRKMPALWMTASYGPSFVCLCRKVHCLVDADEIANGYSVKHDLVTGGDEALGRQRPRTIDSL